MKWPNKKQWRHFFKVLSRKEKIIFLFLSCSFFLSFYSLVIGFYYKNTELKPTEGGIHIEGMVGSPRFINPIYAPTSDVDRDLVELIYSGLMKYDSQGKIVPDLTQEYRILEDGRIYEFYLKENLFWSDGTPLTSDDVIFTVETIQNPEFKSPLRGNWLGVEIEKISQTALRFKMKRPSSVFLENCTLKILPKHIWGEISSQNFPLSFYNLKPIGSGPYQLKTESLLQGADGKIVSLELIRNYHYHGQKPYLNQVIFRFFEKEEDLIKSYLAGEIKGFSLTSINDVSLNNIVSYSFTIPRYFAVFFNPEKAKIFTEKEVRMAFSYGTNKEEIVSTILKEKGKIVDSPVLPEIYGFARPLYVPEFNLEKAKEVLKGAGFEETENGERVKIVKKTPSFQFKNNLTLGSQGEEIRELQRCLARDKEVYPEGEITGYFGPKTKAAVIRFQEKYREEILEPQNLRTGTGDVKEATQEKLNEVCFDKREEIIPLKFSLATVDQPSLVKTAQILASQWKALGAVVEIQTFDISTLEREIIKPRNYEALLFGKILGLIPDPFPFWHSNQKRDPGLNLALFENKKCDKILEEARQIGNSEERKTKLEEFQNLLIAEFPVVFLYNPDYLYWVSPEIKGIKPGVIVDPSKRFGDIENWYIKTRRAWK